MSIEGTDWRTTDSSLYHTEHVPHFLFPLPFLSTIFYNLLAKFVLNIVSKKENLQIETNYYTIFLFDTDDTSFHFHFHLFGLFVFMSTHNCHISLGSFFRDITYGF